MAVQRRGQGFLLRAEHPEGLLDLLNLEGQLLFDLAQQGRIVHRVERPGDTRRGQTERTGVVGRGNRRHTGRGGCGNSRCRSGFGGGRRRRGGFAIRRLKTKLAQLRTDLLHPLGVVRGVGLQGRKLVQQGLFLFLRRLGLLRLRDKERGAHRQDGCQYPNSSLMKRDAKHSYLPLWIKKRHTTFVLTTSLYYISLPGFIFKRNRAVIQHRRRGRSLSPKIGRPCGLGRDS